jgi:MFS family permease
VKVKMGRVGFVLRALRSRNYRLFFSGQLVSLIGTWLTNAATNWLVDRITNNKIATPRALGLVTFVGMMPAFLMAPFAGVLVDRWRKHRLLLWTQSLSMMQSFGLAGVAFWGTKYGVKPSPETAQVIIIWLIGLSMFQGLVNAFDMPCRQAFVVQLVERREDLPNAIALNSSMFNIARLLGPMVAGVLIWKVSEVWCFTIDGFSYLAVLVALLMMKVEGDKPKQERRKVLTELREGISYTVSFRPILAIILLLAGVSFMSYSAMVLMPRFAKEILHGDSRTYGFLLSAMAAGALMGALRLAARRSVLGLGGQLPWVTGILGVGMVVFGISHMFWLSVLGLVLVGYGTMTQMASCNTLLQTMVEDHMRGRVMSLFAMGFMGMIPLGALAAGFLASNINVGPQGTVMIGGVGCVAAGLVFATQLKGLRRDVRPVWVKKGIVVNDETTGGNVEIRK